MTSLYQSLIARLKLLPHGTEPHLRECAQDGLTEAEHRACKTIQDAEAMRIAVKAVKAAQRLYGDNSAEPDMDAIQEASLGALQAIGTWDPNNTATFAGWLQRRAIGAAVDWFRRERGYGMGGRDYVADVIDVEDLIAEEDESLAVEPLEDIIQNRDTRMIEEVISTLPTELRNIVVSYYGYRTGRLTLGEIADRENLSIGTIRNRLHEAISILKLHFSV